MAVPDMRRGDVMSRQRFVYECPLAGCKQTITLLLLKPPPEPPTCNGNGTAHSPKHMKAVKS